MIWADLAAVAATILAVAFLVPQLVKLARTGDPAGVSPTWAAIGAVSNAAWFAYLVSQRLWAAAPSALPIIAFYGLTLVYLRRAGAPARGAVWRGMVWASFLAATLVVGSWNALGLVLGFSFGLQMAPSVWTAYRSPVPSGISPGTWWIGVVEAVLWFVYGWARTDVPLQLFGAVYLVGSALMLARYYATRRRFAVAAA